MIESSIQAYDLPDRVASYDQDMELMHPNRAKMIEIAIQILPFPPDFSFLALDLGVGTGYFTKHFLKKYPNSTVIAIDGAQTMVNLAITRLGKLKNRVDFRIGDFCQLDKLLRTTERFDVAYTSYAFHHLNSSDKLDVIIKVRDVLNKKGWFINADLIEAEQPEIDKRIQEIRIEGIVKRANGEDERFVDFQSTKKFLDELEKNEGDQPLTLFQDLEILKEAGFDKYGLFWSEYREAVTAGIK